jgi:SAM-dependent MidA family methyltransferase
MTGPAFDKVASAIRRHGPLPFDRYLDIVLYDPTVGFYAAGGGAGRRGDFITSPEVGPLFGAVIARALDTWWDELGRPDPFVVVEAGAGRGALARSVLDASPRCAGALHYVMVERSGALRAAQHDWLPVTAPEHALAALVNDDGQTIRADRGPVLCSLAELPVLSISGVVLANELLDNLSWCVLEFDGNDWMEVRVGLNDRDANDRDANDRDANDRDANDRDANDSDANDSDANESPRLVEVLVPAPEGLGDVGRQAVKAPQPGMRIPVHVGARAWVTDALALVTQGRLVVFDYGGSTDTLAHRGDWLRCYQQHVRGADPLAIPGACDVTADVAFDQLWPSPTTISSQADFLDTHGIEELVDEGRALWNAAAAAPNVAALTARSRIREAEALCDAAGLGAFQVAQWVR